MITEEQAHQVIGQDLFANGERIGRIGQVFLDDRTGHPRWITVHIGLFGAKEMCVPLIGAIVTAEGVSVNYTKAMIKAAPLLDVDEGHLSASDQAQLLAHYEMPFEVVQPLPAPHSAAADAVVPVGAPATLMSAMPKVSGEPAPAAATDHTAQTPSTHALVAQASRAHAHGGNEGGKHQPKIKKILAAASNRSELRE